MTAYVNLQRNAAHVRLLRYLEMNNNELELNYENRF